MGITIVGIGTPTSSSGGTSSIAHTLTGSTILAGDLILVGVSLHTSANQADPGVAATGYTSLGYTANVSNIGTLVVLYKVAAGGETSVTVTIANGPLSIQIDSIVLRGNNSSTPINQSAVSSFGSTVTYTAPTTPNLTVANCRVVVFGADMLLGANVNTIPGSMTKEFDNGNAGGTGQRAALFNVIDTADLVGGSGSGTGTRAITLTTAATGQIMTIAIAPTTSTAYTQAYASTVAVSTGFARLVNYARAFNVAPVVLTAFTRKLSTLRSFSSTVTPSNVFAGARRVPRSFASTITVSHVFTQLIVQRRAFASNVTPSNVFSRLVGYKRQLASSVTPSNLFFQGTLVYPKIKMGIVSVMNKTKSGIVSIMKKTITNKLGG